MYWDKPSENEVLECLQVDPVRIGDQTTGRERALTVWRSLLRSDSARFAAIKLDRGPEERKIVGFGASAFVAGDFAAAEVSNPRPGLGARLIERIEAGGGILNAAELRDANTRGDLDILVMYGTWIKGVLTPLQVAEVQMLLALSFVKLHAGFRVGRMIAELHSKEDFEFVEAVSAYRVIARQPDYQWGFAIVTPETLFNDPGSMLGVLFHHKEPVLGLTENGQKLLEAALDGLEDKDLTERLHIGMPAIKRRWSIIFDRIGSKLPELAPPTGGPARGPQKRHKVLAYLREHPEELRPFDFGARRKRGGAR